MGEKEERDYGQDLQLAQKVTGSFRYLQEAFLVFPFIIHEDDRGDQMALIGWLDGDIGIVDVDTELAIRFRFSSDVTI